MEATCLQVSLFDQLRCCTRPVLLLDYDGTLAPFTVQRDRVKPYPGVMKALQQICQTTRTRTIFITGRTADELDRILRPYGLNCEIWGVHGRERLQPDKTWMTFETEQPTTELLQQAETLLFMEGLGELVERKPFSLAVHWRSLEPKMQTDIRVATLRVFAFLEKNGNCRVLQFDGGIELLIGKRDKGDAVRAILKELPPKTPVAYLGDDVTDEDAFLALDDAGLSVLVRSEFRATAASLWIKPPQELVAFLQRWLDSCRGAA
jgi:trehalose 6-phosphate phosphatase